MRPLNWLSGARHTGTARRRSVAKVKPRRRPWRETLARSFALWAKLPGAARFWITATATVGLVALAFQVTGAGARLSAAGAAALDRFAEANGLTVQQVTVVGREVVRAKDVLAALQVTRGQSILAVDVEAARERLVALSWVQAAAVERRLPDTIHVRLVERRPMALWQIDKRILLVDQNGIAIDSDAKGLANYARLPQIVGPDAPAAAAELLELYARTPTLGKRVRAAIRVGKRRWNLRFDNGVTVSMPEEGLSEAWDRLAELEQSYRILARDVVVVDLRQPDRLIVRLSDGAEQQVSVPAKNT